MAHLAQRGERAAIEKMLEGQRRQEEEAKLEKIRLAERRQRELADLEKILMTWHRDDRQAQFLKYATGPASHRCWPSRFPRPADEPDPIVFICFVPGRLGQPMRRMYGCSECGRTHCCAGVTDIVDETESADGVEDFFLPDPCPVTLTDDCSLVCAYAGAIVESMVIMADAANYNEWVDQRSASAVDDSGLEGMYIMADAVSQYQRAQFQESGRVKAQKFRALDHARHLQHSNRDSARSERAVEKAAERARSEDSALRATVGDLADLVDEVDETVEQEMEERPAKRSRPNLVLAHAPSDTEQVHRLGWENVPLHHPLPARDRFYWDKIYGRHYPWPTALLEQYRVRFHEHIRPPEPVPAKSPEKEEEAVVSTEIEFVHPLQKSMNEKKKKSAAILSQPPVDKLWRVYNQLRHDHIVSKFHAGLSPSTVPMPPDHWMAAMRRILCTMFVHSRELFLFLLHELTRLAQLVWIAMPATEILPKALLAVYVKKLGSHRIDMHDAVGLAWPMMSPYPREVRQCFEATAWPQAMRATEVQEEDLLNIISHTLDYLRSSAAWLHRWFHDEQY